MKYYIGIITLTLLISCSTVKENQVGVILDSQTTEVKRTINGPKTLRIPKDATLKTMNKSKNDTIDLNFLTKDGKQVNRKIIYHYSINPEKVDEYLRVAFSYNSDTRKIKKLLDHSEFRAATRNSFGNFNFLEFKDQEMPADWLNEVRKRIPDYFTINSAENIN